MKDFQEMFRKTVSSPYHDKMVLFAAPLKDHFGINHFWYYRISSAGDYFCISTHTEWMEHCVDNDRIGSFSCLRHPDIMSSGVSLMKSWPDEEFQKTRQAAWDKFQVNYHINVVRKAPEGMEAFGFASRFNDPQADERLLNELPLLNHFTEAFLRENESLLKLVDENRVNLVERFGQRFYERPKTIAWPLERDAFLRKMGLGWIFSLTPRERDVLNLLSSGFSASYIADQLGLSCRTAENYITAIKAKLSCSTKTELIKKAKEASAVYNFESSGRENAVLM